MTLERPALFSISFNGIQTVIRIPDCDPELDF
jgi:hypothetical protein